MAVALLAVITILSLLYVVRLTKGKFKYKGKKEIKLLQIIIFTLSIVAIITSTWIILVPVIVILIIILATGPKKFFDGFMNYFK